MKKRILIIDDEAKIREIYKRYFYAIGSSVFEVIETSSAVEATGYMIRENVDVIILDIKMPSVDGRVMFEVIKEFDPDMKIVIASVYPVDQQMSMIPFASEYYDKSQGPMKLLEKVSRSLIAA